jgi:perosamine synthetase
VKNKFRRSIISSRPWPKIKTLLAKTSDIKGLVNDYEFYRFGRDALIEGLNLIGVKPNSTLIVPSLMCYSTILPLEKAGYKVVIIDIGEDLNFKLSDLRECVLKTDAKAIMAVHYFGFPCNISDLVYLCRDLNIKLIEDCCHSFLSKVGDKEPGSFGDIAIFSMRKTLPIHDGGALKLNNVVSIRRYKSVTKSKVYNNIYYLLIRLLEFLIYYVGWPNIYSKSISKLKKLVRGLRFSSKSSDDVNFVKRPISPSFQLSKYLGDSAYIDEVKARMRENYGRITNGAVHAGFEPLFSKLPTGCVPQWAIFVDRNGVLADSFRELGVGASTWPAQEMLPSVTSSIAMYPVANRLNNELLLLPIHHSISKRNCDDIIKMLERMVINNT